MATGSALTLRKIISDGRFESEDRKLLRKPEFFFEGYIKEDEEDLYDENYKYLDQIRNQRIFLKKMEHMFSLSCLQSMSLRQHMHWDLTRAQSGVSIGRISNRGAYPASHIKDVIGF